MRKMLGKVGLWLAKKLVAKEHMSHLLRWASVEVAKQQSRRR